MTTKTDSYHHGNLRESLIDVALDILETEGSTGIKMREIGKRVGVSQSAAYRHFSDKTALLAAIATRGFGSLTEQLAAIRTAEYDSLEKQLCEMGTTYIIFAVEHAAQYRLMYGAEAVRSDQYPELAEASLNMSREYFQMVRKCQKAGSMQGDSPQEVLQVMWASTHGAAMLVIDGFIQVEDIQAFAEDIVTRVYEGIRRR